MRAARAGLAVVAVLCAGCGVGPEDTARPVAPREAPADVLVQRSGTPQPPG